MREPNPSITPSLRAITLAVVGVLVAAGFALFFLPDAARQLWPWDLKQFNAHFLGAVYLASLATAGGLLYYARWAPARLVLPMIFVYTAIDLLLTVLYLGRFDRQKWATWAWFALFLGLPLVSAYYLWRFRTLRPPMDYPTPGSWRWVLLAAAVLLGLYGAAMFFFPTQATAFWPWPIDSFHGRLYSAAFATAATGAVGLVQFAAPVERLTLGATYVVQSLFAVFGTLIVDASQAVVQWAAPATWLWLALFVAPFALGLALIWWSSSQREVAG